MSNFFTLTFFFFFCHISPKWGKNNNIGFSSGRRQRLFFLMILLKEITLGIWKFIRLLLLRFKCHIKWTFPILCIYVNDGFRLTNQAQCFLLLLLYKTQYIRFVPFNIQAFVLCVIHSLFAANEIYVTSQGKYRSSLVSSSSRSKSLHCKIALRIIKKQS